MEDSQLVELADALEAENDLSDARSRVGRGCPPDMIFPLANRSGFIRLAACFLRAAVEPVVGDAPSAPVFVDESLKQLSISSHDVLIGFLQRVESLPERDSTEEQLAAELKKSYVRDRLLLLGCVALVAPAIVVFLIGLTALLELFGFH